MRLQDYDITTQFKASVAATDRLTPADAAEEVREIVLDMRAPQFEAEAGQSVGILAPGQFGQEHHFRLYSLADLPQSTGTGDVRIRICVRRCSYIDEFSGEEYRGIASNYLCDLRQGDTVSVTGPHDLPFPVPDEADAVLLLIGAGTGIAPFRAFLKYIYGSSSGFSGRVVLFHGGRTGVDLLYRNDRRDDFAQYYDRPTFEAISALSRRPHWTDAIDWHGAVGPRGEELWKTLLDSKTYVYVAGLDSIRDQLDQTFSALAGSTEKWSRRKAELSAGYRWIELIY